MKRTLIFFLMTTSAALWADTDSDHLDLLDPECETNLEDNLATKLQIPNCNTKILTKAARQGDFDPLCSNCIPKFRESLKIQKSIVSPKVKVNLKSIIQDEFQRSLTANLMDIVNLRSLYPTNADFSKSINACDIENLEARLKKQNCSPNTPFKQMKAQIAEELSKFLSSNPIPNNKGLLDRSKSTTSCGISDSSILSAKSLSLENSLTPELISKISKIKIKDQASIQNVLNEVDESIYSSFSTHPILGQLINTPEDFVIFFQKLPNPIDSHSLKSAIYASEQNNSKLAKGIEKRCSDAFTSFENLICNKDIKAGKVKLKNLKETEKYFDKIVASNEQFVHIDPENQLSKNQILASICEIRSTSIDSLDLDMEMSKMTDWIPSPMMKEVSFKDYRSLKYENDIGLTKTALCEIQTGKRPCIEGSVQCDIFKIMNKQKDETTPEGRLAKSSDIEINALLRSFIGKAEGISQETRTTLINEGILPKNDSGDLVPQPQVPERSPDYKEKMREVARASTSTQPNTKSAHTSNKNTQAAPIPSSPTNAVAPATNETTTSSAQPSSNSANFDDSDMSATEEELTRRLSSKNKTPLPTKTKKLKAKTTLQDPEELKDNISRRFANTSPQINGTNSYTSPTSTVDDIQQATLPDSTKSLKQEELDRQKLNAYAGMAGAQASADAAARSQAAGQTEPTAAGEGKDDSQGKVLSTVALNIAKDKVTLKLSDLLDKINADDPEGQQLKILINSKQDFILLVKGTSFKIRYSASGYNISFESGNKDEAIQLKPLLEKLLKSVKGSP